MLSRLWRSRVTLTIALGFLLFITACSGQTGQRTAQGGTMGAVTGAAGGIVSALIFGGNVGEAAARGAVWGGSMGAVGGAIVGSQEDQAIKKQKEDAAAKLRMKLGDEAFEGLVALVNCKHDVAAGHAEQAKTLDNPEYVLAGMWLEIMTLADKREEAQARALYPEVVQKDPEVVSEAQAEENMRSALQGLMKIRAEHNLPKTCK